MKQKTSSNSDAKRENKSCSVANEVRQPSIGSKNSSHYLQAIIDSLEDELIVIDREYRIILVNNAVLRRHGKHREEVIGKYCYDISHGSSELCKPPYHECPINEVWDTGKPARTTHIHVYHIKGEKRERYVDIIASPITDSQGNISAIVEVMRDVSEAKELELQAGKAQHNLLALNTIASVVNQSLDLDTALSSALDKTLDIMGQNTGGILLLDEEGTMLRYRVYRGLSDRYAREMRLALGEGIAGRVAQTGKAIFSEDISNDPNAAHKDLLKANKLRAFTSVPLCSKGKILGVLNIASHDTRKFSTEDVRLLEGIAGEIATAIENASLHQEVRHKDEVHRELLREMFSIQEEERRRISRELHDETSQVLASLNASLEVAVSMLPDRTDKVKPILTKAQALSLNILDEIHKLIYELRPTLLDDLGLVAATSWLTDSSLQAAGIKVNFTTVGSERRLPPKLETTLFRIIQEALANIIKHAHAQNAGVVLHFKKGAIGVRITDNGKGFDINEAISSKDRPRGLGLLGMKERVELMNGTLNIQSHPSGGGTQIDIEIPLKREVFDGQDKDTGGR